MMFYPSRWTVRRNLKIVTMAAVLIGLLASDLRAVVGESDPENDGGGSNTRIATVIVRATWSDVQVRLNEEILETLLQSSSVRSAAIRKVLPSNGDQPIYSDEVETSFSILAAPDMLSADSPYLIRFSLRLDEFDMQGEPIPARAEELLHEMVSRLRSALVALSRQNAVNLRERVDVARQRLSKANTDVHKLLSLRRAMSDQVNRVDLTRDSIVEELRWFELQLRELEIERVSHQARQAAVEAHIAKTVASINETAEADDVSKELTELVKNQQLDLDRIKEIVEYGNGSEAEVRKYENQVTEAKIRLAERREMIANQSGADRLPALQQELTELSIRSVELEARLAFARERSAALRPMLEVADRMENEVLMALPNAQSRLQDAIDRLNQLEAALDMYRAPELTMVVAQEDEKK